MLTKLKLRNFKQFEDVEIELANPVVFVGPNNSGKTTALQAIALWDIGLRRWNEKRSGKTAPGKRPGVTINRKDLIAIPIPDANLLWRDLHVRDVQRTNGSQETKNVRIDIQIDGVIEQSPWSCGLEFDYANEESFYCRPLRLSESKNPERMLIPPQANEIKVAFLPPMSGLAANETRLEPGAINVRLGEGRTAEVLRNLCHQICQKSDGLERWQIVHDQIKHYFGVLLDPPNYIAERGEISMTYRTQNGVRLDLSSSGRGLQQTLLLMAHMEVNSGCVLLLDEPDAHLEILRQRQIYQLLADSARQHSCQIIIASHSEIILNEAANRDVVVAFVGAPHRIDDRGNQLAKSLKDIGFEQYYQAEQNGWVLYLEGSTDLAILQAFASVLNHPAQVALERPFVKYIDNHLPKARDHFHGLKEAKPDLVGYALCDRISRPPQNQQDLRERMWQRREIENYLCQPETLMAFAQDHDRNSPGPLFDENESKRRHEAMDNSIKDNVIPAALRDPAHQWWIDTKASDHFLNPVFETYLKTLGFPISHIKKSDYHQLARYVPKHLISQEISEVLDDIVQVSQEARPRR